MPNWCATNYVIRGNQDELSDLCRRLNTMQNQPNGFGKYWMGNLLVDFGMEYDHVVSGECKILCRGTFSPQPDEQACLCGPDIDEGTEFEISEDGLLRCSTVTAWGRSGSMEDFLKEKYPSLEFFFFSTDEFGNFHEVYDPEDLGFFYYFYLDANGESTYYYKNGLKQFVEDFRRECPGLNVPEDIEFLISDAFAQAFLEWREEDESRESTYFYVAEELI